MSRTLEDVWTYPRPPRVERCPKSRARVEMGGAVIVDTDDVVRVLETSHPPTIYLPAAAFVADALVVHPDASSWCEWKGRAHYYDLAAPNGETADRAAWGYADPAPGFELLRGRVAVYPGRVRACWLDGELVQPQAGDFYGGWVTSWITGRMKGGPGTAGW